MSLQIYELEAEGVEEARHRIAQEHGFVGWVEFAAFVEGMERGEGPVARFEAAVDAVVGGDVARLRALLGEDRELVRARSMREHGSTLLHYVSANGVEDFRQKTPANIVDVARMLLDAGAEVDAESAAYGGGCTALGLVATSVHPAEAGVQLVLLALLLERGARLEHPTAGGNEQPILLACLANGQAEAARYLAAQGAPLELVSAAVLGPRGVLLEMFAKAGKPMREMALRYAAGYGNAAHVVELLNLGVDVAGADAEGRTALDWARWGGHGEVARILEQAGG